MPPNDTQLLLPIREMIHSCCFRHAPGKSVRDVFVFSKGIKVFMRYLKAQHTPLICGGFFHRVPVFLAAANLVLVLGGCGNSVYQGLAGKWCGEIKGQSFTVEFRPADDTVLFDGRGGVMRLKEERDTNVVVEMISPDGSVGEAVITPLDDARTRLEIPRLPLAVELRRTE